MTRFNLQRLQRDFNLLIVAEKYQTGFDEPLLHTMFVDKRLHGVKAVQTLSRLNRNMPGKTDTFVLDFVNTAEEIYEAFQPFYEATSLKEEININLIYDTQSKLRKFHVYNDDDIQTVMKLNRQAKEKQNDQLLGRLSRVLRPVISRYSDLPEDVHSYAEYINFFDWLLGKEGSTKKYNDKYYPITRLDLDKYIRVSDNIVEKEAKKITNIFKENKEVINIINY